MLGQSPSFDKSLSIGLAIGVPSDYSANPFHDAPCRGSPSDESRAIFSGVIEEGMVHNAPFVSLCVARELLRCELCKDGTGASAMREATHIALRCAAGAMPGAREDLIELLGVDGLEAVLS